MIVVGDHLPWARGIKNITRPQGPTRWDDSQANVLAGLAEAGEWAYITHDDIVVMRPVDVIVPGHRGPLALYPNRGDYYRRAHEVGAWLRTQGVATPLNFNVHQPFLAHGARYAELADRAAHLKAGFRASIYGNLIGLRARRVHDPKVIAAGARPHPSWAAISMGDKSFKQGYVGKVVRQMFPEPSPYES